SRWAIGNSRAFALSLVKLAPPSIMGSFVYPGPRHRTHRHFTWRTLTKRSLVHQRLVVTVLMPNDTSVRPVRSPNASKRLRTRISYWQTSQRSTPPKRNQVKLIRPSRMLFGFHRARWAAPRPAVYGHDALPEPVPVIPDTARGTLRCRRR